MPPGEDLLAWLAGARLVCFPLPGDWRLAKLEAGDWRWGEAAVTGELVLEVSWEELVEAAGDRLNFELKGEGDDNAEVDVVCRGVNDDRLLGGVMAMKEGDVRGLDNDDEKVEEVDTEGADERVEVLVFVEIGRAHV